MKFDRLRLSGFKSFVDPVDLDILPGMTGMLKQPAALFRHGVLRCCVRNLGTSRRC